MQVQIQKSDDGALGSFFSGLTGVNLQGQIKNHQADNSQQQW
jgi:hypothetical protein